MPPVVEADLGDGDAVYGGVELAVADRENRPGGIARPHRMGATPLWRAKAGSLLNRATPAVSPTSLAAVSSAQPGRASSAGATRRTRSPMRTATVDGLAEPGDVGQFVAGQLGEQP